MNNDSGINFLQVTGFSAQDPVRRDSLFDIWLYGKYNFKPMTSYYIGFALVSVVF